MLINELINKSGISVVAQGGNGNNSVSDICYDSRKITPGALYVSIPGTKVHGDSFIPDAITKGASGIITENPQSNLSVPWIQVHNARNALGLIGKALWGINTDMMTIVGITGTNGKTTVAHLFEQLLFQKYSRKTVWMFGTINYHISGLNQSSTHTTPESIDIFRSIGQAKDRPEGLVMEVSSHSLALDRVGGMNYDCAVWTNLTQDHLDFHKDMENYYQAKKRLFTEYVKPDGCRVINIDDPWGMRLVNELSAKCITYGQTDRADIRIKSFNCDWNGCGVEIETGAGVISFSSTLRGFFNVYNMTALVAGGYGLGMTDAQIGDALNAISTVPGRMDKVDIDAP